LFGFGLHLRYQYYNYNAAVCPAVDYQRQIVTVFKNSATVYDGNRCNSTVALDDSRPVVYIRVPGGFDETRTAADRPITASGSGRRPFSAACPAAFKTRPGQRVAVTLYSFRGGHAAPVPEVVRPQVVQPEVVPPGVVRPEVVKPEVVVPEVVRPEVVRPQVVPPGVVRPEVVKPEVVVPEVVRPEVVRPGSGSGSGADTACEVGPVFVVESSGRTREHGLCDPRQHREPHFLMPVITAQLHFRLS